MRLFFQADTIKNLKCFNDMVFFDVCVFSVKIRETVRIKKACSAKEDEICDKTKKNFINPPDAGL